MSPSKIPFLDLVAPHLELEEDLVSIFRRSLKTAAFVGGPMVDEFEKAFAQYCQTEQCVGVGSGTDALRFALIAAGVRPGDTVITVPNTFAATVEAICQAGARTAFVNIDEQTYNLDPAKLDEYLKTKCFMDAASGRLLRRDDKTPVSAVIPVHLYGQMADMDPILELTNQYGLTVVEDACQAHGAAYFSQKEGHWRQAGSMGAAAAFSFYPGKNLGACGEAGAVTTNDGGVAERIRMLRDHGQRQKYSHEIEGYNGRLDALQAGILLTKLKLLPRWNRQRRVNARRYEIVPILRPRHHAAVHLAKGQKRLSPLRDPLQPSGSSPGATRPCWYLDTNSLPHAAPPAPGLPFARVRGRRFPCGRKGRKRDTFAPHVSSAHIAPARDRRGRDIGVMRGNDCR